jgi:ClpP class serine protease
MMPDWVDFEAWTAWATANRLTLAIIAGLALAGLIAWAMRRQSYVHHRKEEAEADALKHLQALRSRKYKQAEADLDAAKAGIDPKKYLLIDIIHDLGDWMVGRDWAPTEISYEDSFEQVTLIEQAPDSVTIIVLLHTLGGYAMPAHAVAAALKRRASKDKARPKTYAYVPYVAMSGGTIISLAADKVLMGPTASLGMIDTQIGPFALETYKHLLDAKPASEIGDFYLMLAHEAQKYEDFSRASSEQTLNAAHAGQDGGKRLLDFLSKGDKPHAQTLDVKEAGELGMNVAEGLPKDRRDKPILPKAIRDYVDARIRMINTRLEWEDQLMMREMFGEENEADPEARFKKAAKRYLRRG